jgi:hypothetical protein
VGFRFRRSLRLAPGVRLNIGKRGVTSVSVGKRGATVNFGKRGVTGTASLRGTGLSYRHRFVKRRSSGGFGAALVVGVAVLVIGGLASRQSPQGITATHIATTGTSINQPASPPPVVQTASAATAALPLVTKEITAIQANVRAEPSMSGAVLQVLMRGDVVRVLQADGGWLRVARQDGSALGWVHNSVLK